ncbi:hypothetical protein D3C75_860320 [compost metagenome]
MLSPFPVKVHHNISAAQSRVVNAVVGTLPKVSLFRVRQLICTVIVAQLRHIPDFHPVEQRAYGIIIIERGQHQHILIVIQKAVRAGSNRFMQEIHIIRQDGHMHTAE